MSNELVLRQLEETKCTAPVFGEGRDIHLGVNCSVTIYDQLDRVQSGGTYLTRLLAEAGFVQVCQFGMPENVLTGSYLFGEPSMESEATHAYLNAGDAENIELDIWIETDISIGPKSTRRVQGRLGTKSRGRFETAFADELVDLGVEG